MNMRNQYGAGLRTGMMIGAAASMAMALLLIALATASDLSVNGFTGGTNTDKLGGVGSSKSIGGVGVDVTGRKTHASVTLWHIAERLDDDAGISPRYGSTVEIGRRFMGPWRAGLLYSHTDANRFAHVAVGLASRHASVDWLVPIDDSRFGLRARLRAPLSGCWFAQAQYDYVGRQDPDIKISTIGLGIGRSLSRCR